MFTLREIKELIRTLDGSSLTHIELEREGERLILKKERPHKAAASIGGQATIDGYVAVPQPLANLQVPIGSTTEAIGSKTSDDASHGTKEETGDEAGITFIKSPMVGTFYRAPNPDAPPYVNVGDAVQPDTVVCIIEAMKLFNEIVADVKGTIVEVLVQNGTLVEYGQPLFKVRTTS
ncbi:MAG: acetyl-CoA carboxylase biotin carboxyl carrier protein [Candidatus Carbobacillus sp.]|nr:acetyl-CoA carboxylase biotin carboxyl carrier protein [Candidatus Carbobacillus sp.]